ncbi:NADH-quinone oxidoreductase subunit K [Archangium violaceum]|uniref:sodium:proton antiporter n=1 Tax=Archangium violaceum TaxID=83451 RepID=UPI00193B4539|nr:sodium:proton antiporter [Archangium violaceum]QRK05917.1 NADH-quinone oxidoreductase subunit K [Archangium violaceum]
MIAALALTVGLLFGCGVLLVLERELVRMAAGTLLISNASILFTLAAGFRERGEAIHASADQPVTDPVLQALALTAIVISFAVSALLLSLVHRAQHTHRSLRLEALARAEREAERARGPGEA